MNLLTLLADENIINEDEIASIKKEVEKSGSDLEELLVKRGIDSSEILRVKGELYKVPTRTIGDQTIPYDILRYVPEESAKHYEIVPLGISEGVLEVGIVNPDNIEALDALNFISSKEDLPFKVYLISREDFAKVFKMYKGLSGEVSIALSEFETEVSQEQRDLKEKLQGRGKKPDTDEVSVEDQIKEDAPVTKIVSTILNYAVENNASDIHIEGLEDKIRVRFRVDGILHTSLMLPLKVQRAVVARVKVLTSMRLDEQRKPQDGRFSATIIGKKIDFRVSTFPTNHGEKVVMRILDPAQGAMSLKELGLTEENIEVVKEAIKRPYGLILIAGPTGSGKSTTLRSMMQEVDRDQKNVLSLEDPIEYSIAGINQSQVHPEIGYTFASGLRNILRQDPDIIMVGEIRDKETAQLAVQAALTGHIVLSTIHTNNAVGVIPRLIDMGVDPYLIAPTLILTIAQRLVRKLCPGAGVPIPIDESIRAMLDKQFKDLPEKFRSRIPEAKEFYGIEPRPDCPNGTRGRIGAFELLPMTKEISQAVLKSSDEKEIQAIARKQGMLMMKEDAIIKALERVIPFEEVNTLSSEFTVEEPITSIT